MHDIRKNLWRIYAYKFFSSFWLIAPVLIPYYKANGLNATQVFMTQALFWVSMIVLEIPSGYLSDVIGRKRTLVLSSALFPAGLAVYAFSKSFWGFVAAEWILGLAISLRSGTDSALIYDTLLQMEQESEYKRSEGAAEFFHRVGGALSSVLGGLFALVTLQLPFYVNIGTACMLLPLSISLIEPKRERSPAEKPASEMIRIIKFCMTHAQIRTWMLFYALILSSGIVGVWSYYLYYEKVGLSVGVFGLLFAVFGLCSAFGSKQAHSVGEWLGKRWSVYVFLLISLIFIALGLFSSIFLIPIIFLNAFIWGTSRPLFADYVNRLVGSDIRATVLSVSSMAGGVAFIVLSPVFGKLVDMYSLSIAHIALGVFFLAVGLLSLFLLHRHEAI